MKIIVSAVLLLALVLTCKQTWFSASEKAFDHREALAVALSNTGNSYFIYRAQPAGFQYDLLNAYSEHADASMRLAVADSLADRIRLLLSDSVDIIVINEAESAILQHNEAVSVSMAADTALCFTWATRANDDKLMRDINIFLSQFVTTSDYRMLRWKYVEAKTDIAEIAKRSKQLSPYDSLIRKYSKELDWDWRLLASLICQESRFRMDVSSAKGACGLMQLMPATARRFGVDDISDPESNIRAGVAYIRFLEKQLGKENISKEELVKFVLATYNAGLGRIEDCRKYAASLEKNSNVWSNVAMVIPLLSEREHYSSDVLSHGRFKGNETLRFVDEVLDRYHHYKNLLPD